jgi:rubrerythrin
MTIEEILEAAIESEVESYELYKNAVDLVDADHIKAMLRELAQEELGHKVALEGMRASTAELQWQVQELKAAPIQDYKIGDHLVAAPLGPSSTFQDVCIFASKKEQQSHDLYASMAAQSQGSVRDLLEAMAKDELRHKNLVERWYEDVVYQEF